MDLSIFDNVNCVNSSEYEKLKWKQDRELYLKCEELRAKQDRGESLSNEELSILVEGKRLSKDYPNLRRINKIEENEIKELSQKVAKSIPANLVIQLGGKLHEQKRNDYPDFQYFYEWAIQITNLTSSSIDEYIDLYNGFKNFVDIIPTWMNKSHLINISKFSGETNEKENFIKFLDQLDKSEELKAFLKPYSKKVKHISQQVLLTK